MQIFINRNNEKHGPYTLEQIQAYLASGQMQGSDPAWYEGSDGWVNLAQVPGVRVPQGAPPPPYQPAPIPQPVKKKSPFLMGCGGCLGVFVVLGIIGAVFGPKTPPSSTSTSPQSSAPSSSSSSKPAEAPAISVSATQLFTEYQDNEVAADAKYKDKILLITGTVESFGKDLADAPYIGLASGNQFMPVRCVFSGTDKEAIAKIKKGDQVKVRGTCHGKLLGITIAYASLE